MDSFLNIEPAISCLDKPHLLGFSYLFIYYRIKFADILLRFFCMYLILKPGSSNTDLNMS